jgi:hypothetical protein
MRWSDHCRQISQAIVNVCVEITPGRRTQMEEKERADQKKEIMMAQSAVAQNR